MPFWWCGKVLNAEHRKILEMLGKDIGGFETVWPDVRVSLAYWIEEDRRRHIQKGERKVRRAAAKRVDPRDTNKT